MLCANSFEDLYPVEIRHDDIEENDIETFTGDQIECGPASIGLDDSKTAPFEPPRQDSPIVGNIVYDQEPTAAHLRAIVLGLCFSH